MDPPQLSHYFFQQFLDKKVPMDFQPVLQVLEARQMSAAMGHQMKGMRARLSDGTFSYSGCIIPHTLTKRFQEDGLNNHNGIIQVTKWEEFVTCGKTCLHILDYTVYTLDFPVIGNPQSHTGNPEDYRKLNQDVSMTYTQQNPNSTGEAGVSQWRSQVKEEPENVGSGPGSAKRGRGSSPLDQRQPLRKRQAAMDTQQTFDPTKVGITPIDVINPYINKWRICGMVNGKDANIKDISNPKGNFRVFGFNITDAKGSSIRVSAFGEQADKFFPYITNGQVYYISGSGGQRGVRPANKRFNSTGHDYELTLDRESDVSHCEDDFKTPKFKLKPVSLKEIPKHVNECVDIQAIVDRVAELTQVTSRKDQRQLDKREVYLLDHSATEVCFTLWNEQAVDFAVKPGTVLGIQGAIVKEFNSGYTLSTTNTTQFMINPEGKWTEQLYLWQREFKKLADIKTLSIASDSQNSFARDFRLIGVILRKGVNLNNEKGDYFFVKAMVNNIKTDQAIYQACPQPGCKKKVSMEGNQFRCEKCNSIFDTKKDVMMLQVELADFSGTTWVTIFEDRAENILGVKADQLAKWKTDDVHRFDMAFDAIRFREFLFRVRVRCETYNDQQQLKWSVYDIKPVPFDKCKALFLKSKNKLRRK